MYVYIIIYTYIHILFPFPSVPSFFLLHTPSTPTDGRFESPRVGVINICRCIYVCIWNLLLYLVVCTCVHSICVEIGHSASRQPCWSHQRPSYPFTPTLFLKHIQPFRRSLGFIHLEWWKEATYPSTSSRPQFSIEWLN